jgi:IS30 family transposase
MPHVRRPRLSPHQKAELWARWKRGESLSEIARALERVPSTIFQVVVHQGGLPPRARQRAARALNLTEREEIACAVAAGESLRAIGRRLGRAASTISREVGRHGGRPSAVWWPRSSPPTGRPSKLRAG